MNLSPRLPRIQSELKFQFFRKPQPPNCPDHPTCYSPWFQLNSERKRLLQRAAIWKGNNGSWHRKVFSEKTSCIHDYIICSLCLLGWLFKKRASKEFMMFGTLPSFFCQDISGPPRQLGLCFSVAPALLGTMMACLLFFACVRARQLAARSPDEVYSLFRVSD